MKQIRLALQRYSQSYLLPKEFSVPFQRGLFKHPEKLTITDDAGAVIPMLQASPLSYWDDQSIKWLQVQLDMSHIQSDSVHLNFVERSEPSFKTPSLPDMDAIFERLTLRLTTSDQVVALRQVSSDDDSKRVFEVQDGSCKIRVLLEIQSLGVDKCFRVVARIHNCASAKHPGGLWDLGDPGSFEFDSFELIWAADVNGEVETQLFQMNEQFDVAQQIDKGQYQQLSVEQFSSGGEHWNCRNHVDKTNTVPLKRQGFEIIGDKGDLHFHQDGQRIQPLLTLESNGKAVAASIEKFWQNFPSKLSYSNSSIHFGLFPKQTYQHELQAGERKSFDIVIDLEGNTQRLQEAMRACDVTLSRQSAVESNTLPLFEGAEHDEPLYRIIEAGLHTDNNFFAKREQIDEYGWRHFGDLFADHECYGEQGKHVQFSHYNNQYDPIWGFLRQYLTTGDCRWFELADDLARHVLDIDIYRTELDREEYNNGLFWHTDHYSDAATCSHRTFSKHHSEVYEGYQSGGGPGGQHCYTLGLTLYYFLTGSEDCKQTLLKMADWIGNLYEGSPTILGTLYAIKRSSVIGVKNVVTGIYPLDRGTGNYINALLDSYEVTSDEGYVNKAFNIISNTMHPQDDVNSLGLDNIELTWFYSVLLQSVIRFLELKRAQGSFDDAFYYCRDVLNTYVTWMQANEKPYLDQVEKLEFPNLTWAAQDLRRANIFYAAAYYCDEVYLKTAEYFHQYVVDKLIGAEERTHTRILALIMQNIGARNYFREQVQVPLKEPTNWPQRKHAAKPWRIAGLLGKALAKLSIKNELDWLRVRSSKVEQYLGEKSNG